MGIVSPSNHELLVNTLCFGIPAFLFFSLRMINSSYVMGRLHADDYAMLVTIVFYVTLLILINVSARYATNLYPQEQAAVIFANPTDVRDRVLDSKIVVALEQCMLALTWGVKLCILWFIKRLVFMVYKLEIAVRILTYYVTLGYLAVQVTYFGLVCRPFSQYWAMPVENDQCATYATYSKVQMVFNISSDLALMAIPLYMTWTCRLPLRRKAVLTGVFSLALFTIIAAILNKVYNFQSPWSTVYQLWYIRESSVAVLVANIICCWQLLQRIFKLRSFDNSTPEIGAHPSMAARPRDPHAEHSEGGTLMNKSWWDRRMKGKNWTLRSSNIRNHKDNGDISTVDDADTRGRGRTRTQKGNEIPVDPLRSNATQFSVGEECAPALMYRSLNNIV